jgi:hypothetical protein
VNEAGSQYCTSCYQNLISTSQTDSSAAPGPEPKQNVWQQPASEVQTYQTKRCHNCGVENNGNEEYCYNCKANLTYYKPPDRQYPDEPRVEFIPNNPPAEYHPVKCTRCGADNYENTEYCFNCHTSLKGTEGDLVSETNNNIDEPEPSEYDAKDPTEAAAQECPGCNHEVYPEQTYCYYCGLKFSN